MEASTRNKDSILRIRGGAGDQAPSSPVSPDSPIDEKEFTSEADLEESGEPTPSAKLSPYLRSPRGAVPAGLKPASPSDKVLDDGALLAGAGSSIQLEWQNDDADCWRTADWILLPYVHPIHTALKSEFRRALLKELHVRKIDDARLKEKIIEYLTDPEKTNKLVNLYRNNTRLSQNKISMSLYSSPMCQNRNDDNDLRYWHSTWRFEYQSHAYLSDPYYKAVGWLGTGDAALKENIRRDPWLNFFKPYSLDIGVMALPHHGSANNFHKEILQFDNLSIALATTVERRNRVARMRETLSVIEANNIRTQVVDDESGNKFRLCCRRYLKV